MPLLLPRDNSPIKPNYNLYLTKGLRPITPLTIILLTLTLKKKLLEKLLNPKPFKGN
jgi:hypothetical protein